MGAESGDLCRRLLYHLHHASHGFKSNPHLHVGFERSDTASGSTRSRENGSLHRFQGHVIVDLGKRWENFGAKGHRKTAEIAPRESCYRDIDGRAKIKILCSRLCYKLRRTSSAVPTRSSAVWSRDNAITGVRRLEEYTLKSILQNLRGQC
jgi:hypothetical protein